MYSKKDLKYLSQKLIKVRRYIYICVYIYIYIFQNLNCMRNLQRINETFINHRKCAQANY